MEDIHQLALLTGRGLQNCHLLPVLLDIYILEAVFIFFFTSCVFVFFFFFFLWNLLTHFSDTCNNGKLSRDISDVLYCDRFFLVGSIPWISVLSESFVFFSE